MDKKTIKTEVRNAYAAIARQSGCGCSSSCCSGASPATLRLIDYGALAEEIPEGADLGLGCGIPTQDAGIRPGDTVLDLGSGAGIDAFLAAKLVGPEGRVIGVDMTPEMVARATQNATAGGYHNVEFRLGEIEALPVQDNSIDVVISNCVINLVPDKSRAFAEIYRVLKPGGRFCISDIVSYGQVPARIRQNAELWIGCIAGAMDKDAYVKLINEAGFKDISIKQLVRYPNLSSTRYGFASITIVGTKPS